MNDAADEFTVEEILAILDFVAASGWKAFELQTPQLSLYVGESPPMDHESPRGQARADKLVAEDVARHDAAEAARRNPRATQTTSDATGTGQEEQAGDHHMITSPMVGTFYRAPEPGSPPFVEEGSLVGPGDTVALLEVMKLFNTITAGVSGRVVAILASDADLVEYGQPLFAIDTDAATDE